MEKFKVAVKNEVREVAYNDVAIAQFDKAEYVGRVSEGQVFVAENGVPFVVRVIVKDSDYDAQFEVEDFAEIQAKKAEEKAKAKAKGEKAKAKKVKAEAEAKKEGEQPFF